MKFEEIEVGKVYSAEHDVNLYLVTHKGYNYIVVINYSTVHHVAVQQFYAKDYDYSEWYLEDKYYIDGLFNQLVVRKNDEWSDTLYMKNNN